MPKKFAYNLFDVNAMKHYLPDEIITRIIDEQIDKQVADSYAQAVKSWALQRGATHYAHWFTPLTGTTAEKHDSFADVENGKSIDKFTSQDLFEGESDASSFPNGGMRQTFEARGCTKWDSTSYSFVIGNCLYVPGTFCSPEGDTLDNKTPLKRSVDAIRKQAQRILKHFNCNSTVNVTVGAEQEYFLIDKRLFDQRLDLVYTGRTLFGSKPSLTQEVHNHYYGAINKNVSNFMAKVDEKLALLGIVAKTEHNEVAPRQYEIVPLYDNANLACDKNNLVTRILQETAEEHNLKCLLNEKPFDYVNGSGKHVNWSLCTSNGRNLLLAGSTARENAMFLLFITAIIQAVHSYQGLMRASVASLANDKRLGGNEAPPTVMSVYIGEQLANVLESTAQGSFVVGKDTLKISNSADRNRTSPFAYTNGKFEFRMVGSNSSVADVSTVLNTAVADVLMQFADKLDGGEKICDIVKQSFVQHKDIIFNGNCYSESWLQQAKERGLTDIADTPTALTHMDDENNVQLFVRHKVFSEKEIHARTSVLQRKYSAQLQVEVDTAIRMVRRQVLPTINGYVQDLCSAVKNKKELGYECNCDIQLAIRLCELAEQAYAEVEILEQLTNDNAKVRHLAKLRTAVDEAETLCPQKSWCYPTYDNLLFGVE